MASGGERIRVGDRYVDADGRLWRATAVNRNTATLEGRATELTCPLQDGHPAGERGLARVELDSAWAGIGLDTLGRLPVPGDVAAFPAARKLFRVVAVESDTLTLQVVRAGLEDYAEIGDVFETTLHDYLEAWGEGTFSPW